MDLSAKMEMNARFFNYFIFIGKILGLHPRTPPKKGDKNSKKNFLMQFYVPALMMLIMAEFSRFEYWNFKVYQRYGRCIKFTLETMSSVIIVIDILQLIFILNYTKNRKWQTMQKLLRLIENRMVNFDGKIKAGILGSIYIDVCFLTILCILISALSTWVEILRKEIYFFINIANVYYLYLILLVHLTVFRIRNGLKNLHTFLRPQGPTTIQYVTTDMKSKYPMKPFSEFIKYYRMIYDVVQIFNDIFGYHMVFLNLYCILEWLTVLNFIISSIKNSDLQIGTISLVFLETTMILITIIFIFLLCSAVTSEAEYILYVLHQTEDDNHNLKAKSVVIQLVEDMSICFTAARFFNISKYTILGIIGNCTTYFIVLIQFYQ